jgi:hypothetical protein
MDILEFKDTVYKELLENKKIIKTKYKYYHE